MKRQLLPLFAAGTLAALLAAGSGGTRTSQAAEGNAQFDRTEMMVMNLNRGPKSAGFYLLESLRVTRESRRNLDRAISQIEQVDQTYARAKGHPDDRYLANSVRVLKEAQKRCEDLEEQLSQGRDELKSGIQHALISK